MERSGHTACVYRDFMVVFGGIYEVTKELNDMNLFDFRSKRWISFFEETNSPIGKNKSGLGVFGNTIGSRDGVSIDGSPQNKKLNQSSYTILRPMT